MPREMKDSGIEWIGEIPVNWQIIKFWQSIDRMSTGLNPRDNFELTKDDDYYYVTIRNFKNGQLFLDDKCDRISKYAWEIIQQRSQLAKGDILFASISETGHAYILDNNPSNWNINESVFCIRPNHKKYFVKYFYYLITDSVYYNDLRMDATGTTFKSIKQNKLRQSYLTLPSYEEQQQIADFLDEKVSKIDEILEKTKQSIEEYKKLKQAVITQAVTKGLDSDAEMKDSGVDWIGYIPKNWICEKVKYATTISRGLFSHRPRNDERYYNGKYPFIQTGDVAQAKKYITSYSQTLNELGKSVSKEFPKGTLTMTIAANVGDVAILDFDAFFPDSVVGFVPKEGVSDSYLYYIFSAMKEEFVRTAIKSTQLNLNIERVKELLIPITYNPREQSIIVDYLEKKCSDIDNLINKKEQLIKELESYKKSLIYDYVTGKKEVLI